MSRLGVFLILTFTAASMLNKKLKLSQSVLKRFEPMVGYCFYNARNKACINTDYTSGTIVSALDGKLSVKEVLDILIENNKDVSSETLTEKLVNIFENLLKEGFLDEID